MVWCAVHSNNAIGTYFINNETVWLVDYYKMLLICLSAEAQKFSREAHFQKEGALRSTSPVHSFSMNLFSNSWAER